MPEDRVKQLERVSNKMKRNFLKAKLHRATVTEADLNYEGSITIDPDLMKRVDILPYERVEVYNIGNGARFATYAIEGKSGSGEFCVNGAAAHLARPGDKIIVCSYVDLESEEIESHEPIVVLLDEQNRIQESPGLRSEKVVEVGHIKGQVASKE